MKKVGGILSLAVAFCFVMASAARAERREKVTGIPSIPVWQITIDGTGQSVAWVDHEPNRRFAIYDPDTPGDKLDDAVLDKETGLVWCRQPAEETINGRWWSVMGRANDYSFLGRYGWRLPSLHELLSLFTDPGGQVMTLPLGHPFVIIEPTVEGGKSCCFTTSEAPYDDTVIMLICIYNDEQWGREAAAKDANLISYPEDRVLRWIVRGGRSGMSAHSMPPP